MFCNLNQKRSDLFQLNRFFLKRKGKSKVDNAHFKTGCEPFLSLSIIHHMVWPLIIIAGIYKYVYIYYYQYIIILLITTLFLIILLFYLPSGCKLLYYRWLVFRYNKETTFSIEQERKTFLYKHGDIEILFTSDDVAKWNWGYFRRMNTTFVKIVRIRLKNGKKIEISSGIGDVEKFLQENWEQLGIPKGTYRYGDDFKSLQSYIK